MEISTLYEWMLLFLATSPFSALTIVQEVFFFNTLLTRARDQSHVVSSVRCNFSAQEVMKGTNSDEVITDRRAVPMGETDGCLSAERKMSAHQFT